MDNNDIWTKNYIILTEYYKKFNKNPKYLEIYNDIEIGKWIYKQKEDYRHKKYKHLYNK